MRIKSINTQHVLGLRRSKLRFALVFEAVVVSFVSYIVALLLVDLFKNTPLSRLVDGDLAYAAHPAVFIGTALVAILVGFLAGFCPEGKFRSITQRQTIKKLFDWYSICCPFCADNRSIVHVFAKQVHANFESGIQQR